MQTLPDLVNIVMNRRGRKESSAVVQLYSNFVKEYAVMNVEHGAETEGFFGIFPQSQSRHWLAGRSTPIFSIVTIEGRLIFVYLECTEFEGGSMAL